MRARLHLRDGRWGFFREGTHTLCDARATRQLLPATCDAVDEALSRLIAAGAAGALEAVGPADGAGVSEIEVSENVDATERAMYFEGGDAAAIARDPLLARAAERQTVTDRLSILGHEVQLGRHVLAFFQGNRYLLGPLVTHVVGALGAGASAVDLYAGVGPVRGQRGCLQGLSCHGGGRRSGVGRRSARQCGARRRARRVRALHEAVEAFVSAARERPDVLVVDPPRTGMSRDALEGAIRLRAPRVVYVSCDVATLARDARRLVDAGYSMTAVDGFDLFPNTPHVETVAVFER